MLRCHSLRWQAGCQGNSRKSLAGMPLTLRGASKTPVTVCQWLFHTLLVEKRRVRKSHADSDAVGASGKSCGTRRCKAPCNVPPVPPSDNALCCVHWQMRTAYRLQHQYQSRAKETAPLHHGRGILFLVFGKSPGYASYFTIQSCLFHLIVNPCGQSLGLDPTFSSLCLASCA